MAAPGAVVLGVGEVDVAGSPPHRGAQIMQGADEDPIPRARLAAARTGPMLVISTARDTLRGREHLGIGDAQGRVRWVDCRTTQDKALPNQGRSSSILRPRPSAVILKLPVMMLKTRERVLIVATPAALGRRDSEWMIVEILQPRLGPAEGVRHRPLR